MNNPSARISLCAWLMGTLLVSLVLSIQLPGIKRAFSGHFASYQCVMAAMSRNMLHEDFKEVLLPKVDLLIDGQRGLHLNQYPFPSLVAALGVKFFKGTFEFWGRLQAVACNLISILLCGLIGARLAGRMAGWAAACLYGLSPFSLVYGQMFMSESMALAGLLTAGYFYLVSRAENRWNYGWLSLSALSLAFAITGRVHFVLLGPLFAIDIFRRRNSWKAAFIFGCLSLLMPALWYGFTYMASLHSSHVMTNIFVQKAERPFGAIFYFFSPNFLLRIADVLGQRLMTPLIWPLVILGMTFFRGYKDIFLFLLGGLAANLLLILLLPQKVMAHDFYLASLLPFLAWFGAGAYVWGLERWTFLRKKTTVLFLIGLYFLVSFRYAYGPIFKSESDTESVLHTARYIQTKTLPEDKLIVFSRAPAVLGYYANRPHWTMETGELGGELAYYLKSSRFSKIDAREVEKEETAMKNFVTWLDFFRDKGARYFIAADAAELESEPNLLKHLNQTATLVSESDADFYLYRLT